MYIMELYFRLSIILPVSHTIRSTILDLPCLNLLRCIATMFHYQVAYPQASATPGDGDDGKHLDLRYINCP